MQEMSNTHFGLSMLMIAGICFYLIFSINNNIETRNQNDIKINSAKSCVDLSTYYSQALTFENGFRGGLNDQDLTKKIDSEKNIKAKELGCN